MSKPKHLNWERIVEGNTDAHTNLYKEYYDRLYNYGKKLTDDIGLIEDTIQEVFIKIWTKSDQFSAVGYYHSYIYQMFRNGIFRYYRDLNRRKLRPEELEEAFPVFEADHFLLHREEDALLRAKASQVLKSLTHRQREAIYLRFYESLSYEEIAAIMNITVKATYKVVARALVQMRSALGIPLSTLWLFFKL